jgi:GNAT superfamily N-acetyltransferase
MQDVFVRLVDNPDPKHIASIRAGLSAYNIKKVPELLNLPTDDIAVFLRDEQGVIQGGVVAENDWGMLYIDLLWVDDTLRGQGYGKALMDNIEQTALQHNLSHAYLMTTEFQALPFYHHIGYEIFGTLMNRPHGYTYYYLCKTNIQAIPPQIHLPVTINPAPSDVYDVNRGLRQYCEQFTDCTSQRLSAFIYQTDGTILGGLTGTTYWDWFDLRYFWVDDTLRGQGYGKSLLKLAEAECYRRGIMYIVCDTSDFQSLPFYQSQGFEVFATLTDRPPQHESYFLKKSLMVTL